MRIDVSLQIAHQQDVNILEFTQLQFNNKPTGFFDKMNKCTIFHELIIVIFHVFKKYRKYRIFGFLSSNAAVAQVCIFMCKF